MKPTYLLRVSSVRSQNPKGFGGCIFTGKPIDESGNITDAKSYLVVQVSSHLLGSVRIQPGQWLHVEGKAQLRTQQINGYVLTETQIAADALDLILPSGEHVVAYIAESDAFPGIGFVKARKLWEKFGELLYTHLDSGNVEALSLVLTPESAQNLSAAWALHGDSRTLLWLERYGLDIKIAKKVLTYYGPQLSKKLEEDPYRLLSFCSSWNQVDLLAKDFFSITENDQRRLQGAIEEACYRLFDSGNTKSSIQQIGLKLESLLGTQTNEFKWRALVPEAIRSGYANGSYIIDNALNVYPLGPWVMENTAAKFIVKRILGQKPVSPLPETSVISLLEEFQAREGIKLNEEQRLAVHIAHTNKISLITGSAGVGKTTVLKALYEVFDHAGIQVYQVALAGRAAKRMHEATHRPASTLATFLRKVNASELEHSVVVVDEASMIDIITFYRLCEKMPDSTQLVLVGDPSQLMPVGPGLVLHVLEQIEGIPKVQLKVVKRYQGALQVAAVSIREGNWPELSRNATAPISFLSCEPRDIATITLQLYAEAPEITQILSSRRNGPDGTKNINALCQAELTAAGRALTVWSEEFNCAAFTGFYLGDQVLCTRNLWDRGLQNGSLGRIVEIEPKPRPLFNNQGEEIGEAIAWIEWDDGEKRPLFEEMLDDFELGYAITVHKAQGSQWNRVIIPITHNKLLDRTLIYTAITRAQQQVILLGDATAAKIAVESLPKSYARNVALGDLVQQRLEEDEVIS